MKIKNKNITKFAVSLIYILLGMALIIRPDIVEDVFAKLLAGAAIIIGLLRIGSYMVTKVETRVYNDTNGFAEGVSLVIIGLFILFRSTMFIMLVPFVLGFMITYKGIEGLQNILNLKKFGYAYPKWVLIASVIIICFGVIVMINPFTTMNFLFRMLGTGLFASGLFDLVADTFFTHKLKSYAEAAGRKDDDNPDHNNVNL